MNTKSEINHTDTYFITCPYCGHQDRNSWEHHYLEDNINCGNCRKQFHYKRDVLVTYSTQKLD